MEATVTLKMIASRLTSKWKQPYSKTCGYVKSNIAITLVRATYTQNQCAETAMGRRHGIGAIQVRTRTPNTQLPHPTQESGLNIGTKDARNTKTQGLMTAQGPPQGRRTGNREPTAPDQTTPRGDRVNLLFLDVDITDTH